MTSLSDIWGAKEDKPEEPSIRFLKGDEVEKTPIKDIVMWLHHRIVAINEMTNDELGHVTVRTHMRLPIGAYQAICNLDIDWFYSRTAQTRRICSVYRTLQGMYIEKQVAMIHEGKQL